MMSEKIVILAVIGLLAISSIPQTSALTYSECDKGKTSAVIKSVKISDCEGDDDRCIFAKNTTKTIELTFVPTDKFDVVNVKIAGKINVAELPFEVNPELACGNYGFDCPIVPEKEYTFKLSLPVLNSYPSIKVDVMLRLVNDKKKPIVCAKIPAKIESHKA